MCCLKMGLNLKILKMSPVLFAWRYIRKILRTRLIISVMFRHHFENVAYGYDVRKNTADAILFKEIQCKKMDNLMF